MRFSKIYFAMHISLHVVASSPRANPAEELAAIRARCQGALGNAARPVVQRLTRPMADPNKQLVALTSVVPDFDAARDLIIGIRSRKHTYLINAQIGRHDPGILGGRGKFHPNTQLRHLAVSPGLILRLRLTPQILDRVAAKMHRLQNSRNLTCTNTVARTLAFAGVPGMHSFILTPLQMVRAFGDFRDVDARLYLLNSDAESLEDFEDRIKVVGAKTPDSETKSSQPRRRRAESCDAEDSSNGCMIGCLDVNWCGGVSESGQSTCAESGCSECGGCESGACDSGGFESDSDCCH